MPISFAISFLLGWVCYWLYLIFKLNLTFFQWRLDDSFRFTQVIISRNLNLNTFCWVSATCFLDLKKLIIKYIVNAARYDNCILEFAACEIYHSIYFSSINLILTFYFNLAVSETWFFDLDIEILLAESSDRSIW